MANWVLTGGPGGCGFCGRQAYSHLVRGIRTWPHIYYNSYLVLRSPALHLTQKTQFTILPCWPSVDSWFCGPLASFHAPCSAKNHSNSVRRGDPRSSNICPIPPPLLSNRGTRLFVRLLTYKAVGTSFLRRVGSEKRTLSATTKLKETPHYWNVPWISCSCCILHVTASFINFSIVWRFATSLQEYATLLRLQCRLCCVFLHDSRRLQ